MWAANIFAPPAKCSRGNKAMEALLALVPEDAIIKELLIKNKKGLHARASAKFVRCVDEFPDVTVYVSKGGETVGGRSIMGLMLLAAGVGSTIHVATHGPQAQEAMDAIAALIEDLFGEGE